MTKGQCWYLRWISTCVFIRSGISKVFPSLFHKENTLVCVRFKSNYAENAIQYKIWRGSSIFCFKWFYNYMWGFFASTVLSRTEGDEWQNVWEYWFSVTRLLNYSKKFHRLVDTAKDVITFIYHCKMKKVLDLYLSFLYRFYGLFSFIIGLELLHL